MKCNRIVLLAAAAAIAGLAQAGVVTHYSFDHDFSDVSGHSAHGAPYDGNGNGSTAGVGITHAPGEWVFGGGAATFTAERDWVDIPEQIYWNGEDYSFSFWARSLAQGATGGMVLGSPTKHPPNFFVWIGNDYVRWRGNGDSPDRQADFPLARDNDWHHYVLVSEDRNQDGTADAITLYVDGALVGTDSGNVTGFIFDAIGAGYGTDLDLDFEGQIDEVWIFDHALSLEEVRLWYTSNGVPPPKLPGDLNLDGVVNSSDLDLVRANWGTTNPDGDANEDGFVNSVDLDIIRANWGATRPADVPEPKAFLLLSCLLAATTVFRSRAAR